LGFVMPRSVLSADQHAKLRDGTHAAPVQLDGFWDLLNVTPLFNVPACVLFATHSAFTTPLSSLQAVEMEGKFAVRDAPLAESRAFLSELSRMARLVTLGTRTAYSTTAKSSAPALASTYSKLFRQGATVVPR